MYLCRNYLFETEVAFEEQDVCIPEDPPDNSATFNVLLVDDDVPGVGGLTTALTVFLAFFQLASKLRSAPLLQYL